MLASACAVGLGLGAMNAGAASFTVKSAGDDPVSGACAAACNLRDAIDQANLTPGTDTIKFDPAVFPLTKSTSILLDEADDLAITDSLIIAGPGPGVVTIDGTSNGSEGIFDIDSTALPTVITVNISGVTLANGTSGTDGGAIETDDAKVTISNCAFTGNDATAEGGAIYSDGLYSTLTVKDSVFTGNTSGAGGGAIYVDDTSNVAARGVHISNSRFSGNSAGGNGGAVYLDDLDSPGLVENSVIADNKAAARGGGLLIFDTDNRGSITVRNTTISGNKAGTDGGGIRIAAPQNQILIDNSTISGNAAAEAATGGGGGMYISLTNNFIKLRNSTVAGNTTTEDGGGIFLVGAAGVEERHTLILQNTVVADNTEADLGPDLFEVDGRFLLEFSMIGDTSDAKFTALPGQGTGGDNITDVDPNLLALANNGSGRKTHALDFHSSPLDRGSNNICTGAAGATSAATVFDGRGAFRPIDGDADLARICDSGAYEFNGRMFGDCPSTPDLGGTCNTTFTTATFSIKDNLSVNASDSMALKLSMGTVGLDAFGAPTTHDGTAYALCVYFGPSLVAQYSVAAGELNSAAGNKPLWKQTSTATGVTNTYASSKGNTDGVSMLTTKTGTAAGSAAITATAKGVAAPDVTLPVVAATDVAAELYTTDGKCVSAVFPAANLTKNTNTELSAKLP